jgi:hypothetical protein
LKASVIGDFGDDSFNNQIAKVFQASEQTATSMMIRGSFHKVGLTADTSSWLFKLKFDDENLPENKGFKGRSERNVTIEELSRRRQAHRFEIIHAE